MMLHMPVIQHLGDGGRGVEVQEHPELCKIDGEGGKERRERDREREKDRDLSIVDFGSCERF